MKNLLHFTVLGKFIKKKLNFMQKKFRQNITTLKRKKIVSYFLKKQIYFIIFLKKKKTKNTEKKNIFIKTVFFSFNIAPFFVL